MKTLFYQTPTRKTVFSPFDRNKLLAEVSTTMKKTFVDFEQTNDMISLEQYTDVSTILFKLKSIKNTNFERIRETLVEALNLLVASINTFRNLKTAETTLAQITDKASILDSVEAILAYLKVIQMSPFPDSNITVIAAQIRPEYALYIERYGKPDNGIFNQTILQNIIAELV